MFDLTRQEKQIILFLISISLLGLGIRFAVKINSRIENIIKTDVNIAKMDINKVSLDELLHSQYITPKLARKIIEYRDTHGRFGDIKDLKEIKGIGDYRYERLKDLFSLE